MNVNLRLKNSFATLFAFLVLFSVAGTAHAQIVYRGMISNNGNTAHPQAIIPGNAVGPLNNPKNYLNVQTQAPNAAHNDITPVQGIVSPQQNGHFKGMSVSPVTGCNLPAHRRPNQGTWNGTNTTVGFIVWQLNTANLPNTLQYNPDPGQNPTHGVISPTAQMQLNAYTMALAGTANNWTPAQAPVNNCP